MALLRISKIIKHLELRSQAWVVCQGGHAGSRRPRKTRRCSWAVPRFEAGVSNSCEHCARKSPMVFPWYVHDAVDQLDEHGLECRCMSLVPLRQSQPWREWMETFGFRFTSPTGGRGFARLSSQRCLGRRGFVEEEVTRKHQSKFAACDLLLHRCAGTRHVHSTNPLNLNRAWVQ